MIFISYYTLGDYEKVINTHLLPSLRRWNLKYDIESIEDKGNWQKNTHFKAEFCKKMLLKHKESVVFLDADATIEDYPMLLLAGDLYCDYDMAYHELDWYKFWKKIEGQKKREALSGTLYLRYNEKVLLFLDEWIKLNKVSTNWEQKNMQCILRSWKNKLKIDNLPPEYCMIILPNGKIPYHYIKEKPVILHHQVSRKLKK